MLKLLQQLREADVRRALVDDEAHGAFGGMRAHVDHRPGKALVGHDRHGDQELTFEVAMLPSFRAFWCHRITRD